MNRSTVFSVVALLLSSVSGFGADLASASAPPVSPAAVPFNWTGFYIGGYMGGSFGKNKLRNLNGATDVSVSPNGFTGGALTGFNYQVDSFVFGAEGEFGYDRWKKESDFLNGRGGTRHAESKDNYIGRIRGRLGYAVDNVLLYTAGGLSFTEDTVTQSNPNNGISDSISKNLVGWNIGGGAEYGFNSNWIGRVEYIYDGFGKKTYDFIDRPDGFASRDVSLKQSTIRVGLEYKF